jgi:uncharacterized membrane protein YhaH (DUF805 family)
MKMNWYLESLKKYTVFKGRSCRKEYWYFTLFNILFTIGFGVLDQLMGNFVSSPGYGPLSTTYTLAVIIPGIAVSVRRLHDTGKSGWWFMITIVPVIGLLVFLYFAALESDPEVNEYDEPLNPDYRN